MDSVFISIYELLELAMFKCKHCKKRCRFPVMTADKNGNYCTPCLRHLKYIMAEENGEINTILEKFIIPCTYYDNGCDRADKIADITIHEKACEFRDKVCPFYELDKCENRLLSDIPDHFKDDHPECVIKSECDVVNLSFNTRNSCNLDIIQLLVLHNENFLLHIKLDIDNKELLYILYFCGDPEFIKYYECSIQQHNNNIHTTNMTFCLLHESDFTVLINKRKAIHYDLAILQRCFDTLDTVIKIVPKNAFGNVKNSDILKTLKCPSCQFYMRDEICQCVSGHSVCKECVTELKVCAVCKAPFSGTRNYTLETLSLLLKYPCTHKGCNKYFSAKSISRHESDCSFKEYGCSFREMFHCQWNGAHKDLILHVKNTHHDESLQHTYCERKISLDNIREDVYCLIAYDNIFRFHLEKDLEKTLYSFTCKYIGQKSLAKRYMFEIGFINPQQKNNKLIVKNSWIKTSDDELWIEIHAHDVAQYVNRSNEVLLYYKISKYLESTW